MTKFWPLTRGIETADHTPVTILFFLWVALKKRHLWYSTLKFENTDTCSFIQYSWATLPLIPWCFQVPGGDHMGLDRGRVDFKV